MSNSAEPHFNYTPAVTATSSGLFGIGSNLTWDAYQRDIYNKLNDALQQQAQDLLDRGAVTEMEARALTQQRNMILAETRKKVSPFGRLYSEILKPSGNLPDYDKLLAKKGSIEAVIESVGRTRRVVNRLSVVMKQAGRAGIAVQVVVSAVVIIQAKPEDRGRVAAGQVGAAGGSVIAGWAGAWAGCATAALLASPALVVPVVGQITEGTACLAGGIVGGFGLGVVGGLGGEKAGEAIYDMVTQIRWERS